MKTRLASVKSAAVCALREPDACMECHCVSSTGEASIKLLLSHRSSNDPTAPALPASVLATARPS
jgi:hypothetical protein